METFEILPLISIDENTLHFLIVFFVFSFLTDLAIRLIRLYYADKSNYSCADCKAWDCPGKKCHRSWVKIHQNIDFRKDE